MEEQSNNCLLCVFGATGQQGGAVLRWFAQNQNTHFRLRGVTRNKDSQSARELERLGIEMVTADLNNPESLKCILPGVTHIFATTDSNRIIFDAIRNPEILPKNSTPRSYAYDLEIQQGKNLLEAAVALSTLQVLVWSSLASPKKWSSGHYSEVTMWDAKEDIADMFSSTPEIRNKLRVIIPGFFMTNALNVPELYGPRKLDTGIYELALPMSGETEVPIADLDADLGRWVKALFAAIPGTTLVGASATVSWRYWLELWGDVNKVSVQYRRASLDEFGKKVEGISEAVLQEFQFIDQYGFTGGNSKAIYPDQLRQQGIDIEISDLQKLMNQHDWSPLLH